MELKDIAGTASDIATVLVLLAGGCLAVFVFLHFAPVLALRIQPTWPHNDPRWVILRIEVENKSRVRVYKQSIYLQVLEYEIPEGGSLSEWVPFEERATVPSERPISWHEPVEILTSTTGIDPGEVLVVERLHYCPPGTVLHVGLQARARLGLIGRIATQVGGWNQRWTTTRVLMKESHVTGSHGETPPTDELQRQVRG
jgi:hypothetical protein